MGVIERQCQKVNTYKKQLESSILEFFNGGKVIISAQPFVFVLQICDEPNVERRVDVKVFKNLLIAHLNFNARSSILDASVHGLFRYPTTTSNR